MTTIADTSMMSKLLEGVLVDSLAVSDSTTSGVQMLQLCGQLRKSCPTCSSV